MFEIFLRRSFSSAHALRHYHGKTEPLHGHNFEVEVIFRGKHLQNKVKYLADFMDAQRVLEAVVKPMEHVNLNETPPFSRDNPSAENIALHIGRQVKRRWHVPGVRVASITVWETPSQAARYLP